MAASYPVSLKVFTTRVDGETIFAPHINEIQDEVAAVQAELGTDPSGTSYTTVKARIANLESTKLDTSAVSSIDHNSLANLTTGDPHTQYLLKAIATAKGDLLAATGSGAIARQAVGTNGYALVANSAQTTGMNWAATYSPGGTDVAVADGGTGASSAAAARVNLDIDEVTPFAAEGTLAVKIGKGRFRFPYAVTILGVSAVVDTPPTGASAIFDVNRATAAAPGTKTTIFTTQGNRPTIAASAYASSETVPDITAFAAGDHMTVDIDQIGSTVAGADALVFVRYRRA